MTTSLMQYPRPPADTGWGFHDSAGADSRPNDVAAFARYLRQDLGITWFKALVNGTNKVDMVRTLCQQGIEVVVRLYALRPHPHYCVSPADVRAYVEAGAHYFEWGNEPNLSLEWDQASWHEGARVDKVCEQFLRNADAIRQGGGIPLFPALAPGGEYPHRDFYRTTFAWLRQHNHMDVWEGAALAIHNRPFNRPVAHLDALGCSFLDYEWIDDLVRTHVGRSLPLIGTEAGYEPGDQTDPTFPAIDLPRHAAYNLEILRGFSPRGSRPWRDALFCECMWLVDSFGHKDFSQAAWHKNNAFGQGQDLPAVSALRQEWQAHPFQRTWTWEQLKPDYALASWRGSPNSDPRPAGVLPQLVVLHATGQDFNATVQKMRDAGSGSSLHYLVARSGAVYQFVPEAHRAWHAKDAAWNGRPKVNDYSIAIGLVNRNDGHDSFPGVQLEQTAALVRYLQSKYGIETANVATIGQVRGAAAPDPNGFNLEAFQERLKQAERPWPSDEEVRHAAWAAGGVPYNPEAAFARYAREKKLGNPETPEFDFEFEGKLYRGQGFSEAIVYCEIGHWDQVQSKPW